MTSHVEHTDIGTCSETTHEPVLRKHTHDKRIFGHDFNDRKIGRDAIAMQTDSTIDTNAFVILTK